MFYNHVISLPNYWMVYQHYALSSHLVQANTKENTKTCHIPGHLYWESTGDQWIPLEKG